MTNTRTTHGRPIQTPFSLGKCKQEAARLFALHLEEFRQAPEATYMLHKQYFSIYPYEKQALHNDTIQIPRRDFIWEIKYSMTGTESMIGLKSQPSSLARSAYEDREIVEIITRDFYLADEPGGTIHHTLLRVDGRTVNQVNTAEAVMLVERLLAAFCNDFDR